MKKILYFVRPLLIALIIVCVAIPSIPIFDVTVKAASTYYVATTGNDSADGSFATPWLTIQHAADNMTAGDTVYVRAGTYNETVEITTSGTAGAYITYENYLDEVVIVDGTALAQPFGLIVIDDADYINIDGFTIQNHASGVGAVHENHYITLENLTIQSITGKAINVVYDTNLEAFNDGKETYITIDNCTITDCASDGVNEILHFVNVSNFEFKNNTVYDCDHHELGFITGCHDGDIYGNEYYGLTSNAVYIDARGQDVYNINIYQNKFHDTTHGILINDEVGGSTISDVDIYNNLFYNITTIAIDIYHEMAFNIDDVRIYNNTFYNNAWSICHNHESATETNSVIANNIFWADASTERMIYFYNYAKGAGMTVTYNLFYTTSTYFASNDYGSNSIKADPKLVLKYSPPSPYIQGFGLLSSSPAIDAASSTYAPSTDYLGIFRPQGYGDDIGAYEYVVSITAPSIIINSASLITQTTARLNSWITSDGGDNNCYVRFGYGLNSHVASDFELYTTKTSWVGGYEFGDAPYLDISSLSADTIYYYSVQIKNSLTTVTSLPVSFHTLATSVSAPNITALEEGGVGATSALLRGYITEDGDDDTVQVRFGYGTTTHTSDNFTLYDTNTAWVDGFHILDTPTLSVSGLSANTTYYYRVQVKNDFSTVTSSNEITFATSASLGSATVFNGMPSSTSNSLHWVKPAGSYSVLIRYRLDTYPTTTSDGIQAYFGSGVNYNHTGLTAGTTYFYSLWGFDGTSYSASASNLILTTYGYIGQNDGMPIPTTLPGGFNQTPDSAAWYEKLQPFTGVTNYFATDWGMNKDVAMSLGVSIIIVVISVVLYVRWRNIFAAYGLAFVLVLGATQMTLLPFWAIFVMLAFGMGIWGIERAYQ